MAEELRETWEGLQAILTKVDGEPGQDYVHWRESLTKHMKEQLVLSRASTAWLRAKGIWGDFPEPPILTQAEVVEINRVSAEIGRSISAARDFLAKSSFPS